MGLGPRRDVTPLGLDLEAELPIGELSLLIKFLNGMGDLPRINVGDAHNRGERLTMWRIAMETQLKSTRRVVVDWWRSCNAIAEKHYRTWLQTPILMRNTLRVHESLPRRWESIEDWFLPKLLAIVPVKLKDSIMQERLYGADPRVVEVIFHLLKIMQPGSMDEQDHVHKILTSPNPCREPAAALKELRRWFAALKRAVDIGMTLPGLDPLYRGAGSIYSAAFEGDDFGLRLRWTSIEQQCGYPHQLSHEGLKAINQFAEAELGAMVINGRGSANTSFPLTETQKSRAKGEKEVDKKRAAAARSDNAEPPPTAAAITVNGQRHSASTSNWANLCSSWKDTGCCGRGINCWFQHEGFAIHDADGKPVQRCIVCGSKDHLSRDCAAPGGQADPDKEKNWESYRARKEEAAKKEKGKGKGKKGKGKGKGK